MGQVLAVVAVGALEGIWLGLQVLYAATMTLVTFAYFFLIIVPISCFGLVRRDDDGASSGGGVPGLNTFIPTIVALCPDKKYEPQLQGQAVELEWWNRTSGEARVCWKGHQDRCGRMHGLFLYCWDWSASGVPDAIPKVGFAGQDPYTPNGTISIRMPNGEGPLNLTWAAPIAGECKYWDREWRFQPQAWEHTDPKTLAKLFEEERWMPPVKKVPYLAPPPPPPAARGLEHFSHMPRKEADGAALDRFAATGARILRRSIEEDRKAGGNGTRAMLQQAFTAVLEAHGESRGSLWKRMTGPAPMPADRLVSGVASALINHAHGEDRGKMETFAIDALVQAVSKRARSGRAAEADFFAMNHVFERIFGGDVMAAYQRR